MTWASLESLLNEPPRFYVQPPDGIKDWSEDDRQRAFFSTLHKVAPKVMAHHTKNEGNYNHVAAAKSGVVAGVFDITVYGEFPLAAMIELKGYRKSGKAGDLSQKQIDWGNKMFDRGWPVACFFDPYDALRWLRDRGFPIGEFSVSPRDAASIVRRRKACAPTT